MHAYGESHKVDFQNAAMPKGVWASMNDSQNVDLEKQIKEIRREIAALSAILAIRELEERHPLFKKIVDKAEAEKQLLGQKYHQLSTYAHENGVAKGAAILGAILALGTAGYAVLSILGLLGDSRK